MAKRLKKAKKVKVKKTVLEKLKRGRKTKNPIGKFVSAVDVLSTRKKRKKGK